MNFLNNYLLSYWKSTDGNQEKKSQNQKNVNEQKNDDCQNQSTAKKDGYRYQKQYTAENDFNCQNQLINEIERNSLFSETSMSQSFLHQNNIYQQQISDQKAYAERFQQKFSFITNQIIVNSIQIGDYKLFYQPYKQNQTVETLTDQYQRFSGQELKLQAGNIKISPQMPIIKLIQTFKQKDLIEEIIQQIQHVQKDQKIQIIQQLKEKDSKLQQKIQQTITLFKENKQQHNLPQQINVLLFNMPRFKVKFDQKDKRNRMLNDFEEFKNSEKNRLDFNFKSRQEKKKQQQKQEDPISYVYYVKDQHSTIQQIIKKSSETARCQLLLNFLQIKDHQNNIIYNQKNDQNKKSSLIRLVKQNKFNLKTIKITYLTLRCFFRSTMNILTLQEEKIQQLQVKKLIQKQQSKKMQQLMSCNIFMNQNENNLLSYNDSGQLQPTFLGPHQKVQTWNFLKISLMDKKNKQIILQCSSQVLLMNQKYQWICGKSIRENMKVLCVDVYDCYKPVFYTVRKVDVIRCDNKKQFQFYALSVPTYNNFIVNSIVVHNRNSFKIKVCQIVQKSTIQMYNDEIGQKQKIKQKETNLNNQTRKNKHSFVQNQVYVFNNLKIKDIFADSKCMISGMILNNQRSFGDYQIQKFTDATLYIYPKDYDQNQILQKRINKSSFKINCNQQSPNQSQQRRKKNHKYYLLEYDSGTIRIDDQEELQAQQKSQKIKQLPQRLKDQCMGIYRNRIISMRQFQRMQKENYFQEQMHQNINILLGLRGNFQRMNFIENIEPQFKKYIEQCYQSYIQYKVTSNLLQPKYSTALRLYTTNLIYKKLNLYLRTEYARTNVENENQDLTYKKWMTLTAWIYNALKKLPDQSGVFYRGLKDINLQKAYAINSGNETLLLNQFTSTSTDFNEAKKFSNQNGAIITLIVRTGKNLQSYTRYESQKQRLLSPFSYFAINKYDLQARPQTAQFEQIPMPFTNSKKIVFWVDDQPQKNKKIIDDSFTKQGIEVVQITNTRIILLIINKFFWMLHHMQKKLVIISNLERKQNGIENKQAGIDLFYKIYMEYGLSNKGIIYSDMKKKQLSNEFDKKGIKRNNWTIMQHSQISTQLIKQTRKAFEQTCQDE